MDHGPLALIIDVLHTVKENIIAHVLRLRKITYTSLHYPTETLGTFSSSTFAKRTRQYAIPHEWAVISCAATHYLDYLGVAYRNPRSLLVLCSKK